MSVRLDNELMFFRNTMPGKGKNPMRRLHFWKYHIGCSEKLSKNSLINGRAAPMDTASLRQRPEMM